MAECKTLHVLSRDGNQVSLCECGTVSISVGPVTVRVPRAQFDRFAQLVQDAAAHFRAEAPAGHGDPAGHTIH